jgi:hypothetical protein
MTAQERLDYLLETEWVPTNALITIGTIRDSAGLSPQEYGLVRTTLDIVIATLKASSDPVERVQGLDLQDALSAMLAGGISLSGLDRQSTIDALAVYGQWSNSVRDAIKELGGVNRPRWQSEGYDFEPTLEQIEAEIAQAALRGFADSLIQRVTAAINLATVADDATEESIKAAAIAEAGE